MFKLSKFSEIRSTEGEEQKIIPEWNTRSKLALIPGFLLTIAGFGVTAFCAFRRGSIAYENAEYKTMCDLGIIETENQEEDVKNMISR